MRSLSLSDDWLAYAANKAGKLPEDVVERRTQIAEARRRLQKEYLAGRLEEPEYDALRLDYDNELALLPTARRDLVDPLAKMESFSSLWGAGSAEARNDACRAVFDRVVLDMQKQTIEFYPAQEFEPLFRVRHALHVTDIRPARGSP